jgi:hypothetical protein
VIVNLSGRGDKDIETVSNFNWFFFFFFFFYVLRFHSGLSS